MQSVGRVGIPGRVPEQNNAEMPTSPVVSQVGRKRKARKRSGKPCLIIFLVELVIFVPSQLVSFNLTKAAPFDILVQIPGNQDTK